MVNIVGIYFERSDSMARRGRKNRNIPCYCKIHNDGPPCVSRHRRCDRIQRFRLYYSRRLQCVRMTNCKPFIYRTLGVHHLLIGGRCQAKHSTSKCIRTRFGFYVRCNTVENILILIDFFVSIKRFFSAEILLSSALNTQIRNNWKSQNNYEFEFNLRTSTNWNNEKKNSTFSCIRIERCSLSAEHN